MIVHMDEKNRIKVKMFGNFQLSYHNQSIFGKRAGDTQFTYLMQIILHNRKTGVSRGQMEELLFGDRDIQNVHHAMWSVIYNAKKRLRNAGLPDVEYIHLEKGIFYWTEEIPVEEDATEFESLYEKAQKEKDTEKKLRFLLDACYCYTGEFLFSFSNALWVISEARKYKEMFCVCVEEAADILKSKEDYIQLEKLGRYASSTDPFSDWEKVTMDALVSMGRYDEAIALYSDTVDIYFKERGIRPSEKLADSLNNLSGRMLHPYKMLDSIQKELDEKREKILGGGYFCSYPIFCEIYNMVNRMMERGGQSVYLMLCTIMDSKGNPMKKGERLKKLSERLGDAIIKSIRRGDAVSQYSEGQYLVLLINTTMENCEKIQRRINSNFIINRQRTGVQYYVSGVPCFEE